MSVLCTFSSSVTTSLDIDYAHIHQEHRRGSWVACYHNRPPAYHHHASKRQNPGERKKHFPENAKLPFFFTSPPRQNQTAIFKTLLSL